MISNKVDDKDKVTDIVKDTFITNQSDSDNMIFNKNYYKFNKEVKVQIQNQLSYLA
jgi:hypothetical protein